MGRDNHSIYKPVDKIASIPWGFVKLVCGKHKEKRSELILENTARGPFYRCNVDGCTLSVPAAVHERLLDEVIKILNIKGGLVGYTWKKRILGQLYGFEIYEYDFETGMTVGVDRFI